MSIRGAWLGVVILVGVFGSCSGDVLTRRMSSADAVGTGAQGDTVLKLHLRDGGVVVMSNARVDRSERFLIGRSVRYDVARTVVGSGLDTVAFDDVALVESNSVSAPASLGGMAAMSTVSVIMTGFCMANPKACFGSCPTFYAWNGESMTLQAEGFSSSIAPVLRATDLDALYRWKPRGRVVEIVMTNEALETHVVDHVELRAVPRTDGGRVVAAAGGELFEAFDLRPVDRAIAAEGDVTALMREYDARERVGLASEVDLVERETIEIEFDSVLGGDVGLVVGFRESLMTTYLFYQGLAYLGSTAGEWIARCERDSAAARATLASMQRVLGRIEILVQNDAGEWSTAGEIDEAGPIAQNLQMVRLPHIPKAPLRLRLRMSKGLWRLGYLAIARLGRQVEPIVLRPLDVRRDDAIDTAALAALLDPARSLVTTRGDRYTLRFALPDDRDYELFLESRGYYLEWMRTEWLAEENPARAAQMFLMPAEFLRAEAPRFKAVEPSLEEQFWSSRYVRH